MFNRYSLCAASEYLSNRFHVDVPEGYKPSYNAAPSHLLPLLTQDSQKGFSFFYWGAAPVFANRKPLGEKIINARSELFAEKQNLKKRLLERKCLIPADGFFEWKKTGKKAQIPYRFTRKDKALFAMAGLWEEYEDENGEPVHTFSIITTASAGRALSFNDRMPVMLDQESEMRWLNSTDEAELLAILSLPAPDLDFYSVSSLVNSTEVNDKRIIMPAPAADQFGNLSLFD